MRLIADGVVDREGVPGLAARLGYSTRQIERQLLAELGAGPLALARAQRAQTARLLIETTALPMADVAFAAGFASIRTFNDTVREVFALSPTRAAARAPGRGPHGAAVPGALALRLPFRAAAEPRQPLRPPRRHRRTRRRGVARRRVPAHPAPAVRARHRRPHARAPTTSTAGSPSPTCATWPSPSAAAAGMLDLDADPVAVDELLRADPLLAPLVDKAPGRRVPRTVDAAEFAVRAVLGQQVSTAAARTHAGPAGHARTASRSTTRRAASPTSSRPPRRSPALDPEALAMPRTRRATLTDARRRARRRRARTWASAATGTRPAPGSPRCPASAPGPSSASPCARSATRTPSSPTDLGIRRAAQELGPAATPRRPSPARAAAWRPWRAYAVQYLWATDDHPINHLPRTEPAAMTVHATRPSASTHTVIDSPVRPAHPRRRPTASSAAST